MGSATKMFIRAREYPLDGAEWADLDSLTATLWGIMVACLGLAFLAFAWWPL